MQLFSCWLETYRSIVCIYGWLQECMKDRRWKYMTNAHANVTSNIWFYFLRLFFFLFFFSILINDDISNISLEPLSRWKSDKRWVKLRENLEDRMKYYFPFAVFWPVFQFETHIYKHSRSRNWKIGFLRSGDTVTSIFVSPTRDSVNRLNCRRLYSPLQAPYRSIILLSSSSPCRNSSSNSLTIVAILYELYYTLPTFVWKRNRGVFTLRMWRRKKMIKESWILRSSIFLAAKFHSILIELLLERWIGIDFGISSNSLANRIVTFIFSITNVILNFILQEDDPSSRGVSFNRYVYVSVSVYNFLLPLFLFVSIIPFKIYKTSAFVYT